MTKKTAIVLFNLGGPDSQKAIQPFLQNLFSDPAIIRAPAPIRWVVSRLVSRLRAPNVAENYAMMNVPGGGSPLLPETEAQARAIEAELARRHPDETFRCFIAMRYWHPFTHEAAEAVMDWAPDETILLPLYPQFSSTTTGSSLSEWHRYYRGHTRTICCYPFNTDFIETHARLIQKTWKEAGAPDAVTLLMSAHGLPERVVKDGDPYQWQVEEMASRLAALLPETWDKQVCYQSRVGPLKWIGPSTEDEIERAARTGNHILVAPIAFVSDHIETLVELDIEYRELAEEQGVTGYTSVPALGTDKVFIGSLCDEIDKSLLSNAELRSCEGSRLCPDGFKDCPFTEQVA